MTHNHFYEQLDALMKIAPTLFAISMTAISATTSHANILQAFDLSEDFISCESHVALPDGYQFATQTADCQYHENLAVISKNGKYGYATPQGKIIIEPIFEMAENFDNGLALIKQNGKYGYLNPKGTIAIKPQFDNAWGFWENRAKIEQHGRYGFIDKKGKIIINPTYTQTGDWFENGLVRVQINNKWGFIDKDGKLIVKPIYDIAADFSEGLASVGIKYADSYRYGFINSKGELVIDTIYDIPANFIDDIAFVIKDNRAFYIDKQGREVGF